MTTPAWQAPVSGARNNLNATDASAHHNQFLSTHAFAQLGYGNVIVRPNNGDQGYFTHATSATHGNLNTTDFAQSFTMSGTTIGRVTIPLKTFGNGADVLVSLCPDNAGNPNLAAPLCQVKVPASVLTATGAQLGLENATLPWQMPYNNTYFATNFSPHTPWISPAATTNGAPSYFATCASGNFGLLLGGYDTTAGVPSALCFTVQYTGAGTIAPPIPQPSLPLASFQATAITTADTVIYMGGTGGSTVAMNNVWSASWNSSTGVIGAWSSQTALPVATTNGGSASWGSAIYYVGGNTANTFASGTTSVYMASVTNSQVGTWKTVAPLPRALSTPFVAAINGWLVVAGGVDTSSTARAETYYAAINATDGSLGNWQQGPNLVQPIGCFVSDWCKGVTTDALILYAGTTTGNVLGQYISVLAVTPEGVAPSWNVFKNDAPGAVAMNAFTDGNGVWYLMGYNLNNTAAQNFFQAVPVTSVPLYMTGLTNGATYWVVVQETQNTSTSDYVGIGLNFGCYADAKSSPRHQNTWTTFFSGTSVPLTVYDTTLTNPIVHTVEDLLGGTQSAVYQKWSTLAYDNNGIQTGIIEVTMQPNNALNSNPTFTSGVSPWTATNGTITQSNAQTHGGFAFSGLLTPTGGFTQAYATSEQFPVQQTTYGSEAWYLATGWFYSPTGTTSFSLSVNWADSSGAYISTTSSTITLAANSWTQVSNWVTPPATAAYASLVPTEGGTPGPTNLIYISDCYMIMAPENVEALTSIAQINYQTGTSWPPVGVTQLN